MVEAVLNEKSQEEGPTQREDAADAVEASFAELLQALGAEHTRAQAENERLRADIARLQIGGGAGGAELGAEEAIAYTTAKPWFDQERSESKKAKPRLLAGDSGKLVPEKSVTERTRRTRADIVSIDGEDEPLYQSSQALCRECVVSIDDCVVSIGLSTEGETEGTQSLPQSHDASLTPQLPAASMTSRQGTRIRRKGTASHKLAPQLHDVWVQPPASPAFDQKMQNSITQNFSLRGNDFAVRGGDTLRDDRKIQFLIIGPNSKKRMFWDAISTLVLSIDIIMVPLLAFDIPATESMTILGISCTTFWTLDIVASCLTGYHDRGVVEMRPCEIVKSYLLGWFTFDLIVVCVDWFLIILGTNLAEVIGVLRVSKLLRFSRVIRVFRLLRLLRMLKMPGLMDDLAEYIQTDGLLTAFNVVRSLGILAVVNHFLACGWYAIGNSGFDPAWVQRMDEEGRDLSFRYITSLHWSLTQFTPASMEIFPRSFPERLYAICVLFLALVVFSSFVSSITNATNQLRQKNEAANRQRDNIRRYIHENRLSLELGNRITAFARHQHVRTKTRVHERDVAAFRVLPESLRVQLHWEVYAPIVSAHPFFFHMVETYDWVTSEVCHTGLGEQSLLTSEELFFQGQEAKTMYFVLSGSLEYYLGKSDIETATLSLGDWCCEVTLWLKWIHQGRLSAVSRCEFAALDGSTFRKCACRHVPSLEICQAYARAFLKSVTGGGPDEAVDIWGDHDTLQELAQRVFAGEAGLARSKSTSPSSLRPWHTYSLSLIRTLSPTNCRRNKASRANTQ